MRVAPIPAPIEAKTRPRLRNRTLHTFGHLRMAATGLLPTTEAAKLPPAGPATCTVAAIGGLPPGSTGRLRNPVATATVNCCPLLQPATLGRRPVIPSPQRLNRSPSALREASGASSRPPTASVARLCLGWPCCNSHYCGCLSTIGRLSRPRRPPTNLSLGFFNAFPFFAIA